MFAYPTEQPVRPLFQPGERCRCLRFQSWEVEISRQKLVKFRGLGHVISARL